jgi:alpha/beta superfamily hydrolase
MILHPHPQAGGTMNDRVTQALYKTFVARGFATLRFNFRGVGRSQGSFDNGVGELSDAAAALDWVQSIHPEASSTWIAGYSFGALIGMQLLMRRPEIAASSRSPRRPTCMISASSRRARLRASSCRVRPIRS